MKACFADYLITGGEKPGQEESRKAQHRDSIEYCPCEYYRDGIGKFRIIASSRCVLNVVILGTCSIDSCSVLNAGVMM